MSERPLKFEVLGKAPSGARAGLLHTRRGTTPTPTFMPVATHAHVRGLEMSDVALSGASICLANTYHLLLRPGPEVFEHFKGIHRFMQWSGGVLTDSGGFQIFSLPGDRDISEQGARFRSSHDNHQRMLSPETSIATQQSIGSDIMMVLDVCVPSTSDERVTEDAMHRTHRWALRSLAARNSKDTGQALFAIVQGGVFSKMRTESAGTLSQHDFDGFAIGGLAVGESRDLLYSMTEHTAKLLPSDKPRYLMGVGTPIDLVEAVNSGVDMFDCIIPNKMAQQGYAYTFEGQIRVSRTEYKMSDDPLDPTCLCHVCRMYSRGYLRHLSQGPHHVSARLLTIHNLWHYQALMQRMRTAILENRWDTEYRVLRAALAPPKQAIAVSNNDAQKEGDYEVVTLKSGSKSIRHTGHGEVMHPVGPWEEANALYVEQPRLAKSLTVISEEPFRILDVGLGAATNAIAALTCARNLKSGMRRSLEIVSLEHDTTPLKLILADPSRPTYLEPWRDACERLLSEGSWEAPGLSWRLIPGDARESINEFDGVADLIYFDPFSPESNPSLWTVDFLRTVRLKSRNQGARLVTYSAATPTRVTMLLAGFYVGHGVATGTRGETTIAATRIDMLDSPLSERWFTRWQRSSARGPHGQAFTPELENAVRSQPQFAQLR